MSDLPEPRGRGSSDLEVFDEIWRLVKAGIILCFFMTFCGLVVGMSWGWIRGFF